MPSTNEPFETENEYLDMVMRLAHNKDGAPITIGSRDAFLMAALGLAGEAGEVVDIIKKRTFHPAYVYDGAHLVEEMGDVLWYLGLMCLNTGTSFHLLMERNLAKLKDRYPERLG